MSTRHLYAVAVAVERGDGTFLCGLRSRIETKDYRGFWSIPSTTVTEDVYQEAVASAALPESVLSRLEARAGLVLQGSSLIREGERVRGNYHLHQAVFSARPSGDHPPRTYKYECLEYLSVQDFLERSERLAGTCVSLYLQHLIDDGRVPSTIEYLEVSPEIADKLIDPLRTGSAELWQQAAGNYDLLLQGRTGTDGKAIRACSIDRYMSGLVREAGRNRASVLDVGCGNGSLIAEAIEHGADAWGLELQEPSSCESASNVMRGDICSVATVMAGRRFDLVIANLVLEWIDDLDQALGQLARVTRPDGRLVATFTPPGHSHAGQWCRRGEDFSWLQTKSPRRAPELVMVNRCVGPVRYYPRSVSALIGTAAKAGFVVVDMDELYLDTLLSTSELAQILEQDPQLRRHMFLPLFTIIVFAPRGEESTKIWRNSVPD